MFSWMSEELRQRPYDLESMRYWHIGADAMHAVHIAEFTRYGAVLRLFGRKLIGSVVTPGFGMSELGGPVMMPLWFSFSRIIPRCMGRAMPWLGRIKVGDELGRPVPRGQTGYLWVKANGMLRGYWNRHESYVPQISNGYFRTGDLVRQDHRGRFFFLDRETDQIRTVNGPVYSLEVEEVLLYHPAILEVAVVAVPDSSGNEVPLAVGYLKEGASATPAELLAWARQRLPAHSVPADFVVVQREELPVGPTLKVQKYKLRERYASYLRARGVA
jgi:long-chain acyl-CoA synthetase